MATTGEVIDGRYVVGELLGRGGMAEVFGATDTATDRAVAIKLLQGKQVPKWVKLTPLVWSMPKDKKSIKANYSPSRAPTYSARLQIKPWTTYSTKDLFGCKGP